MVSVYWNCKIWSWGSGWGYSNGGKIGGGGGGAGGITSSVFALKKGENVTITINTGVTISYNNQIAFANQGNDGTSASTNGSSSVGSGGNGGSASGGNTHNANGNRGSNGTKSQNPDDGIDHRGIGGRNSYMGYSAYDGNGGAGTHMTGSLGNSAYAIILRGNTNLKPDQQNALDITSISLDISELQQMQTDVLMGNIRVD